MRQFPSNMSPQKPTPPKNTWRNFLIILLILSGLTLVFSDQIFPEHAEREQIPLSELQALYQNEQLQSVELRDEEAVATFRNNAERQVVAIVHPGETIQDLGFNDPEINEETTVQYISTKSSDFWIDLVARVVPFLILVLIFFLMMRAFSKGAAGAFSFGKSKDRLFQKGKKRTRFSDVAGYDEPKKELEEIVEFLKSPKKFTKMGAKIPKGVLLIGPPGTGKTLLARAVAGEADVPFFSISGSEFVEMFVGVGASRVRDLFEKAKKNAPAIIFIDEIDAVGKQRGQGMGGGHDEREQTLNQILTEMDGFDNETNVIVMAATNRPDVLDKALLRPGRFDRRVSIDLPQLKARKEILEVHARNKPLAKSVDLMDIARITPGFSGADLENLLNEAAILAAREDKTKITEKHLNEAHEKVVLGLARRSLILKPEEKKITAYHEAGHAIISHVLPKGDPVRKVTIIPRGMALGVTWNAPEEEEFHRTTEKYFTEICIFMGGRAAEKMVFSDVTSGASSDIKRATQIARNMVMRFGMSDLGPMEFSVNQMDFLGGEVGGTSYSQEFAAKVDIEVQKILQKGMEEAEKILKKHKQALEAIAEELLKKETIDKKEFEAILETPQEKKAAKKKTAATKKSSKPARKSSPKKTAS